MRKPAIALIHSPLVGPFTWSLVALALRKQGWDVVVPTLSDNEDSPLPHWQQHAQQIADALTKLPTTRSILWVAHSGAGLRLPIYRLSVNNPVAGYIFVDAGIPKVGISDVGQGLSQLEWMACESATGAHQLQQLLNQGDLFPNWTDEMLREEVPNPTLRAVLIAELQPHGLRYFNEPLPVFEGWPDARCAYIHFSASYDEAAKTAKRFGWPVIQINGGHFHMIVNPLRVANAIVELADKQLKLL